MPIKDGWKLSRILSLCLAFGILQSHGVDLPPFDLDNLDFDKRVPKVNNAESVGEAEVVDDTVGAEVVDDAEIVAPLPGLNVNTPSSSNSSQTQYSSAVVPKENSQVAILCYHDFSETKNPTEMRMKTSQFKEQMESLKASGIPVISMKDLLDWKHGDKLLPAFSVIVTIDDGWKAVYTDAYPVLKALNYPFTLFLYTKYVNSGGASLTWDMVKEMMQHGAEIGSHSSTHPYPADWRKAKRQGDEKYKNFIRMQLADSKKVLEENLGVPIETFCYPGGYNTPAIVELLKEAGYKAGFTVKPEKTILSKEDALLPRYVVYGTNAGTWTNALKQTPVNTTSSSTAGTSSRAMGPVPTHVVHPKANSIIALEPNPISINLAMAENIDPSSIVMRVSGVGVVSGKYNPANQTYTWQPNRILRGPVSISVAWAKMGTKTLNTPVEWVYSTKETVKNTTPKGWIPK